MFSAAALIKMRGLYTPVYGKRDVNLVEELYSSLCACVIKMGESTEKSFAGFSLSSEAV